MLHVIVCRAYLLQYFLFQTRALKYLIFEYFNYSSGSIIMLVSAISQSLTLAR